MPDASLYPSTKQAPNKIKNSHTLHMKYIAAFIYCFPSLLKNLHKAVEKEIGSLGKLYLQVWYLCFQVGDMCL